MSEPKNNNSISGLIEFKSSDKDKAVAILDKLLNTMKMKR